MQITIRAQGQATARIYWSLLFRSFASNRASSTSICPCARRASLSAFTPSRVRRAQRDTATTDNAQTTPTNNQIKTPPQSMLEGLRGTLETNNRFTRKSTLITTT